MKTTNGDIGEIRAEIEVDWRGELFTSTTGSISTLDGGTMWPTTSTGSGWTGGIVPSTWTMGTSTSSWLPWSLSPWPVIELSEAQQAMILDAIADQLVHPPIRLMPSHTWGSPSRYGAIGTIASVTTSGEDITFTATYLET